ncbi:hypothetical protein GPALN_004606 [Globodera pallida]|nr:hypothetical protein GPALN_004606 [Globodera pallida]
MFGLHSGFVVSYNSLLLKGGLQTRSYFAFLLNYMAIMVAVFIACGLLVYTVLVSNASLESKMLQMGETVMAEPWHGDE